MKLVCIEIPPSFVNLKLTINKIYDSWHKDELSPHGTGVYIRYRFIKDEIGNVVPIGSRYFMELDKWREQQIDKLLG
jgi:hypothetical protein